HITADGGITGQSAHGHCTAGATGSASATTAAGPPAAAAEGPQCTGRDITQRGQTYYPGRTTIAVGATVTAASEGAQSGNIDDAGVDASVVADGGEIARGHLHVAGN